MGKGKGAGPGRPPLGRLTIQITITPAVRSALARYCRKHNRNMGDVVDQALAEMFDRAAA